MKYAQAMSKGVLGVAAMVLLAGQASAKGHQWSEIDAEIKSCVATVGEHANYDDASMVRHAVVDVKERVVGYKLTIETSIYDESGATAIREYATSCVVNGNFAPLQFSINETGDDA